MLGFQRFSVTGYSWAYSALLLLACSGPPTVRVGRIVIDTPRSLDGTPSRDALRTVLQERLSRDRHTIFAPSERDAPYMLHVRVTESGAIDGSESAPPLSLLVLVRLRPLGSGLAYEATALRGGAEPLTAILSGFDDAWHVLAQQRQLDVEKDDSLIARLADPDPRLRDFAIIRLGDRKSRAAVVPLCRRLTQEEKPELILRIVGSLVAIGDPRAVDPIIELTTRREPEFVLQIVYAIGAIGGRTAEAYLVTVASGHPIEAVRHGAEQALAEMKHAPPVRQTQPKR